jgi:ribulose-phosphate 3-epimerase
LSSVIDHLDHVIVMSVHPGFGGQSFIPGSFDKVREVRDLVAGAGHVVDIEVDGGVDLTNAAALAQAGATILVAGASVFGTPDPAIATRALLQAAQAGAGSA